MTGNIHKTHQMEFYQTPLESIIDIDHELVQLTHKISWDPVVQDLAGYFSEPSRSEVSLRKVAGLLILKNLYNLSDEQVLARWRENPYFQYFTGEKMFQKGYPFYSEDFAHIRKRIGKEGEEKVLNLSISIRRTLKEMSKKKSLG